MLRLNGNARLLAWAAFSRTVSRPVKPTSTCAWKTRIRYFVTVAFSGIVGVGLTTVTVWGWVPYTQLGFRAVELGLLIEATLLALAVAYLVREHDAARRRAERLREIFANRALSGDGATIKLRASFGIATLDEHASLSALIKEADDYLYQAKQQGRDRICGAEGLPKTARALV